LGDRTRGIKFIFANPATFKPYGCIFHSWKRIREAAGIGDVRVHDLRHSFASTLVNAGVSLYEVQSLLGHRRATTTQRYAHLAPDRLKSTVALIDRAYGADGDARGLG
jgi:site-specific recombinase XerD